MLCALWIASALAGEPGQGWTTAGLATGGAGAAMLAGAWAMDDDNGLITPIAAIGTVGLLTGEPLLVVGSYKSSKAAGMATWPSWVSLGVFTAGYVGYGKLPAEPSSLLLPASTTVVAYGIAATQAIRTQPDKAALHTAPHRTAWAVQPLMASTPDQGRQQGLALSGTW